MKLTINGLIAFKNQLALRKSELDRIRSSSLAQETKEYDGTKTTTDPIYNVKVLDKKITEIQNWLFKIDSEIKAANAKTEVNLDVPVDELLSSVE